jgi:lauroyl/myristoyl acyltransferase
MLMTRDKLLTMLREHEANGEIVKKEDIEHFFSQLKQGRAG